MIAMATSLPSPIGAAAARIISAQTGTRAPMGRGEDTS